MVNTSISATIPAKNNVIPCFSEESLYQYLRKISKLPILSQEEEKELARLIKEGNEEARQKLIQCNLRLVVQIAKRSIHKSNVPFVDLIQEGNLGLITAVEKFNWEYGYKFSTYAAWWIRQAMFKAISEQSFCVKIPVYIQETLSRYNKAKREADNSNTLLEKSELAEKIKVSEKKIDEYLNTYTQSLSLEASIELANGKSTTIADTLEDNGEMIFVTLEKKAVKDELKKLISSLKEREQNVINWRFGMDEIKKRTLEEIGHFYGVTKECIRQTELRAIKKLKASIETQSILSDYYREY